MDSRRLSVVIPAKNESPTIGKLVEDLRKRFPESEIVVVDDGSSDDTAAKASRAGANVVSNPYSAGNGSAIKRGARVARGDYLLFLDADGQHDPTDVDGLLDKLDLGFDMAVGARRRKSQASFGRRLANGLYNRLASYVTGHTILDLTSGFRAARAEKFRQFLYLLPNGFSYPTTITMAFFRAGYSVGYIDIETKVRNGRSHIRPMRDGIKFLIIIFKIGTLYSPLKVFFPASAFFFLMGLVRYVWTFIEFGRFTNMSVLLIATGALIFMMGLISEQISNLLYANTESRHVPKRQSDKSRNI